jgi:hypothetical protein
MGIYKLETIVRVLKFLTFTVSVLTVGRLIVKLWRDYPVIQANSGINYFTISLLVIVPICYFMLGFAIKNIVRCIEEESSRLHDRIGALEEHVQQLSNEKNK